MSDRMTVRQWLDALRDELGTDLDLSTDEQRALLDMTRVAAHRSERIAAPLSAFLAGLALADSEPTQRAAAINRVTAALEEPTTDTGSRPGG
jgi:hypothetical protein